MHNALRIGLLLIFVLATSGCGLKSVRSPPVVCPVIPPLPANLRTPLNAEKRLSELLLESAPSATPSSEP